MGFLCFPLEYRGFSDEDKTGKSKMGNVFEERV